MHGGAAKPTRLRQRHSECQMERPADFLVHERVAERLSDREIAAQTDFAERARGLIAVQ